MEEPLNLSIKKRERPVAVVPPSSPPLPQIEDLIAHTHEISATTRELLRASTSENATTPFNNSTANFLEQHKSLDMAKMYLEKYQNLANQFLGEVNGLNGESSILALIHTNMLTNKIATNNLISLLKKLLEQNIVIEYYWKRSICEAEGFQAFPRNRLNNKFLGVHKEERYYSIVSVLHFEQALLQSFTRSKCVSLLNLEAYLSLCFIIYRTEHQQHQAHHHHHPHQKNNNQLQTNECKNDVDKKKPHIKKPLNAFMLYMKEMRAKVVAECTLKESAAINQILGRRVSLILILLSSYEYFKIYEHPL